MKASASAARAARPSPPRSPCARFPSAKAWSGCSRSIRPTSTASRWCAVAGPPRQAVLPARPSRQIGPYRRGHHLQSQSRIRSGTMKAEIHPEYHSITVKMTDGTDATRPARPGARKATRCRWTSTRWRTRPGRAAGQADGHRRPRVEVQEQVRRSRLLIRLVSLRRREAAPQHIVMAGCADRVRLVPAFV